jgi:hypothetical protein
VPEFNFGAFLRRAKQLTEPAGVVELGEATLTPRARQLPSGSRSAMAEHLSLVEVDKKAPPIPERVPQFSAAKSQKQPPRRAPSYVWRSQRYRNSIFDMRF